MSFHAAAIPSREETLRTQLFDLQQANDALMSAAESEGRDLTQSETQEIDANTARFNELEGQLIRVQAFSRQRDMMTAAQPRLVPPRQGQLSAGQFELAGPLSRLPADVRLYAKEQRITEAANGRRVSISAVLRGILTGRWDGMEQMHGLSTGTAESFLPVSVVGPVIDAARDLSVVAQSGTPTVVVGSGSGGQIKIPAILADPVPTWVAELQPIPEACPTIGGILSTPKKVGPLCVISNELLEDCFNVVMVDAALERSLGAAIAQEIDRVSLVGAGTGNEPAGILNATAYPGVTSIPLAGAELTNADLIAAYFAVLANHYTPTSAILPFAWAQAYMRGKDTTGQPLAAPIPIAELPKLTTSKLTTQGVVGDWKRGAVQIFAREITVARSSEFNFAKDAITLRVTARYDLGVINQKAFAALNASLTTRSGEAPHERKPASK